MNPTANDSLINLSKDVKIVLAKRSAPAIRVQVGAVFDLSGSAEGLYSRGTMQRTANRCFALAYEFDDNQVLESWGFHNHLIPLEPITEKMFGNYTQKHIINNDKVRKWGGTAFAPVVIGVGEFYFGPSTETVQVEAAVVKQPGFLGKMFGAKAEVIRPARTEIVAKPGTIKLADPAYAQIITDGENSDEDATIRAHEQYKDRDIFFQYVGINNGMRANFAFIEKLAKMFPNVGFFDANMIDDLSNVELYEALISTKFINWYANVKAA